MLDSPPPPPFHPWTVGVSPGGVVLFCVPWKDLPEAWRMERFYGDRARIYLVASDVPPPQPGAKVRPAELGWTEAVLHQPDFVPA